MLLEEVAQQQEMKTDDLLTWGELGVLPPILQ